MMSITVQNKTFMGWLGGWNNKKPINQLSPYELSDALNIHFDLLGAAERRDGSARLNSLANVLTGVNVEFYGLYEYRLRDGTSKILSANGVDLRVWDGTNDFATFTGSTTVVADDKPVHFATVASGSDNICVFSDEGNSALGKVYNNAGTLTAAALGGVPAGFKAKYVVAFQDRIFALNIVDDGAGRPYPADMWFSNANNAEAGWAITQSEPFNRDDGDDLTGAVELNGKLIVFKRNSLWVFGGYGLTTFSKEQIAYGVGCIAPKSIKVIGEAVYFLSKEGVMRYSFDGGIDFVGQAIQKTFTETINPSMVVRAKCVATHDPILKQYILAVPSTASETKNDLFLVFHYRDVASMVGDREQAIYRGAWTKYSGTGLKACSMAWIEGNLSTQGSLWIGSYDGYARQLKTGNFDDRVSVATATGSDIEAYAATAWLNLGNPNLVKRVLHGYPIGSQTASFNCQFEFGMDFSDGWNSAANITFEPANSVLFGIAIFGVDYFQSSLTDLPQRKKISLRGAKGHHIRFRLYNTGGAGKFKWHGVGLDFQGLQVF